MTKKLIELFLNNDGEFSERELVVLKDTKKGRYLGRDESGKMLYDQIPATVWQTDGGKIDISRLGEVRKAHNGYTVVFLAADGVEYYKDKLKKALINEFQSVCNVLEERKDKLQAEVRKVETTLVGAFKALIQTKEKLGV